MIDVSKYTAHKAPGKFEGETAATEYFYAQMMDGHGETIFPNASDDDSDDDTCGEESTMCAELFQIDAEEAEAFDLNVGDWFLLREDSQGFALGSAHASREEAEKKFNDWAG